MKGHKINEQEFWRIIQQGSKKHSSTLEIFNEISDILSNYPLDEIINFECIFRKVLQRLNHSNVVSVAEIIPGGSGDSTDGFLYFRCWLVLKGEHVCEYAIQTPDRLPELIDLKKDNPSAEDLLNVSGNAYTIASGAEFEDDIWDEMHEKLKIRCPGIHYDDVQNQNRYGPDVDWDNLEEIFPVLWKASRK